VRHDHQCPAVPLPPGEGALGARFRLRVEVTGCFIEKGERGVRQIGPGQRDQLPLARGQRRRVDRGAGTAEGFEQRGESDGVGRVQQLRLGHRVGPQMAEVLGERPTEDVRLLRDEHTLGACLGHGPPVHPDRAVSGLQQSGGEGGERGFPDTAWSYDGQMGALGEGEGEVAEDGFAGSAVGEGDGGQGEGWGLGRGWAGGEVGDGGWSAARADDGEVGVVEQSFGGW
jgi:hypothetical protein